MPGRYHCAMCAEIHELTHWTTAAPRDVLVCSEECLVKWVADQELATWRTFGVGPDQAIFYAFLEHAGGRVTQTRRALVATPGVKPSGCM